MLSSRVVQSFIRHNHICLWACTDHRAMHSQSPTETTELLCEFSMAQASTCLAGNDLALQNVFYALTTSTSTRKKNVFHFQYINQTLTAHLLVCKIEDSPWLYLYQIRVWRQFSQISGYKRVKPWDLTGGDEAWRAVEALSCMLIGSRHDFECSKESREKVALGY